jgi:hypothetical protein
VVAQAGKDKYDYDLVIIGCGVGGHGAALHAVEQVGWAPGGAVAADQTATRAQQEQQQPIAAV